MAYIFNQYINPRKTIKVSLTNIYGIGLAKTKKMLDSLCFNLNMRTCFLTPSDLALISRYIKKNYEITSILRKNVRSNIQRQGKIRSYRGFRHKKRLPLRGQRTHTNAHTARKIRA